MKRFIQRFVLALKAFIQLGGHSSFLFVSYKFGLKSGLYRRTTPIRSKSKQPQSFELSLPDLIIPDPDLIKTILGSTGVEKLLAEADEIVSRKVRLFGGQPRKLVLEPGMPLKHWSQHTETWLNGQDIKLIWEPGRFGWATVLARAFHLSRDEKYKNAFWQYTEEFLHANPANQGPHWASAQEAALRLITLAFCCSVFTKSQPASPQNTRLIAAALESHAARILPTLNYARAQNNNHLLVEAVGLYTASVYLPGHPEAKKWQSQGWKWFNKALQDQIAGDGIYIQHSANYHRLMLQTALWFLKLADSQNKVLPKRMLHKLAAAVDWLQAILDKDSGGVPNLGPNDGAYFLPLTVQDFSDFRPTLQAGGLALRGKKLLAEGPWDEMAAWLNPNTPISQPVKQAPDNLRLDDKSSWAYLRAGTFIARPGHADQLHLDLWWRGYNLAQDAGTYLYNAPPPWQNSLSGTDVHNTVMVDNSHQMTPAGRFLWLDWAQAEVLDTSETSISAEHNGYRRKGTTHRRKVELTPPDSWVITDTIISAYKKQSIPVRLHWLLPDWGWELNDNQLRIESPHGWVSIIIESELKMEISLVRAGELLSGDGPVAEHRGWVSPTYGEKVPALSLAAIVAHQNKTTLLSKWTFPG